jgi:hypothetical protein
VTTPAPLPAPATWSLRDPEHRAEPGFGATTGLGQNESPSHPDLTFNQTINKGRQRQQLHLAMGDSAVAVGQGDVL